MGTRQEWPNTSGDTSLKGEETSTYGLKREDTHQQGAGCDAGRRSLTTQGPKNKKGEESSSWNLPTGGQEHRGYGIQAE